MLNVAMPAEGLQFRRTGLGNYTYHLTQALAELQDDLRLTLIFNYLRHPQPGLANLDLPASVRARRGRWPIRLINLLLLTLDLPAELVYGRPDVLHVPDSVGPFRFRGRLVVTIHDLLVHVLPRLFPERYSAGYESAALEIYRRALPRTLERADALVAISHSTASDLQELFGVSPDRIRVIPYGVDERFRPLDNEECRPMLARYGLSERPFVLLVGRVEHRKNHVGALHAFQQLKRRGLLPDHMAVLCGGPGSGQDGAAAQAEIDELELGDDLQVIGYVDPEEMVHFYAGADALLFPSLYEGFGFPVLEAMASGTPVVTSTTSSLPEVAGSAGICVDPNDVEALAEATYRCLTDSELRRKMRDDGLARAREFTWQRAAADTLGVYKAAA